MAPVHSSPTFLIEHDRKTTGKKIPLFLYDEKKIPYAGELTPLGVHHGALGNTRCLFGSVAHT